MAAHAARLNGAFLFLFHLLGIAGGGYLYVCRRQFGVSIDQSAPFFQKMGNAMKRAL